MIIYHREKQTIVIPAAFGEGVSIAPQDCEEAIAEAFQSGWTEGFERGYAQGQYDCPTCDCTSAVTEAFQSGWTAGFNSGSAREVRFDMRVASAYEFHPLWTTGHSATINGNDAVVLDVFGTGSFDDYVVKVATLESGVTTMEVTLNFQNNGGVLRIPSAFTSVQMNECYYLNIISQSRELVQEGRELKYKYSFTFDTTPFYDKLSYEAGLAACQNE